MNGSAGIIFRQLLDLRSSTYTYLLADSHTRESVLIDSVFEQVRRDAALISRRTWRGRATMAQAMVAPLPPTSPALKDGSHRPYFLWWSGASVAELHAHLADPNPEVRAYWMGALLREANTRDVWLFVTPDAIRAAWNRLQRHLGRSRAMWAYLLRLPDRPWPPARADIPG